MTLLSYQDTTSRSDALQKGTARLGSQPRVDRLALQCHDSEDALVDAVERLAELGTVLEVCPGSNIALNVFPDFDSHPLRALKAAGVKVCLNSDDPPFFHTSLSREYALASEIMDFTEAELNAMTRTALEAAFVDEETCTRLLARLDAEAGDELVKPA